MRAFIYRQLVDFESDEFDSAIAKSAEEAQKFIEVGFEYFCEMNKAEIFGKRKQKIKMKKQR